LGRSIICWLFNPHALERVMLTEKRSPLLDRKDGLIALLLGLFSLFLYVRTLLPGLLPGDGGEFQTLAYTLDHAHTTGYHVYVVLTKLFTLLLPVGDIAYRVNLFSAVMGALTIGLVYMAARLVSRSRWGGVIGALALAISATFWSQSIIAEVYTLGSAFTAAILLMALLWHEGGSPRWLFAAGILGGMGIGVHGTVILLAPAVLFLVLLRWKEGLRVFLPAAGGAVLGVLLLLAAFTLVDARTTNASILWSAYIPSASRWDVTPEYFDSFSGRFSFLVFARQWQSEMFANPDEVVPRNMARLAETLRSDFGRVMQVLFPFGLIALTMRRPRIGLFFIIAILFHWYYTFNYSIWDIYVFFVSLYVYYAVLAAESVGTLLNWMTRLRGNWPRILQPALAVILLLAVVLPFAASRVEMVRAGEARWEFMELPSNRDLQGWHDWIGFTVDRLPQDAVVLMGWYNLYGYVYVAHVEQNRPDLLFMEAYPYSTKPGMADSLLEFLQEALEQGRPVYTMDRLDELQRGGMVSSSVNVGGTNMFLVEQR
jgi:hypothetical protein